MYDRTNIIQGENIKTALEKKRKSRKEEKEVK